MENNVVSLETAKKLRSSGWLNRTEFAWGSDGRLWLHDLALGSSNLTDIWPAPTAQETADQLPNQAPDEPHLWLTIKATQYAGKRLWVADFESDDEFSYASRNESLSEALAALWLSLKI